MRLGRLIVQIAHLKAVNVGRAVRDETCATLSLCSKSPMRCVVGSKVECAQA